jgi:hypothetical protein
MKVKGINNDRKILKIHVYDENATSRPAETMFMDGLVAPEKFFPTAGVLKEFEKSHKSKGDGMLGKIQKFKAKSQAYISQMSTKEIKQFVSRAFPTIRYGSQQAVVKSVNVSANTDDEIVNARLMNALKNEEEGVSSNITKTAKNTDEALEEFIIPTSIDMAIYGCPFITMGLNVFVDMQTGTDIDNVYMVGDVSHTISAGEYSTNLSLYLPQIGTSRDMRSRLLSAAGMIDEEKLEVAIADAKQLIEEQTVPLSPAEIADAKLEKASGASKTTAKKRPNNKSRPKTPNNPATDPNTSQSFPGESLPGESLPGESLPDDINYIDGAGNDVIASDSSRY